VALILDLAAGDLHGMMGGTLRRRLHPQRVAQLAHMGQGVAVALAQRESQMGDARRRRHRKSGTSVQLVVQDVPEFVVAHLAILRIL
jgi:hypothetical protein